MFVFFQRFAEDALSSVYKRCFWNQAHLDHQNRAETMAGTSSGIELLVPTVSDVIFKYTWVIKKYARAINKRDSFDSPSFDFNVNGVQTRWNMSIRFWKGPEGKRLTNPVVLCLNLLSCSIDEPEQARVRFQFGVYNVEIKQWEMCHVSRVVLHLQNTHEMLSLGYRDLSILERHMEPPGGDVSVFVKLQLVQTEADKHSLSQDLARMLAHTTTSGDNAGDIMLQGDGERKFPAHKCLLSARSPVLAAMIKQHDEINYSGDEKQDKCLELPGLSDETLQELLRYIYTDHVDNLDSIASTLLPVGENYRLPGLKLLCERTLVETITPESVASLLLLADQFGCDALKRAALAYCEDNATSIKKSLAWKVMELVNPDLFMEACEAGLGSSISSNLDSIPSDTEDIGL
ncbi:speckle-type POZ protein B-like isoform X2 [Periplaneta americana]|uniref:speckle-type POZ protein B-like isoform X2 n=1 Tax=Periplaneta americana TaxID=6978 RepID=UPI0037E84592